MGSNDHCFVEWKEQFVSKERGHRVVHYFLKDISGESILAVVGTERSVRHMFYVVSDEFLKAYAGENSVCAGFRWRSRREVVNWLTSMLSKQHLQSDFLKSPKDDHMSAFSVQPTDMASNKGSITRNLRVHSSDIVWSGEPWICSKQLKHYPTFCRNGITIAVHAFVFVMAEKENHYLAYLEDMYEDRKGQKKVKVRWFHFNREVRGVITLRNPHPREVFITPYAQVISAECVDGPAIVLTREHYEKCVAVFPNDLLTRVHFCFRQFKGNRVKPFELGKMRGYLDQSIFSCFSPDFFEDEDFSAKDDTKIGAKRPRKKYKEHQMTTYEESYKKLRNGFLSRRFNSNKHVGGELWYTPNYVVNEKIECLSQDSGIRGCWFRCTVLEVSRRQMKIRYDDIKDEDGCGNLEEWIPTFRLARPDKLGMRNSSRPTIRPFRSCDLRDVAFDVGAPVDAWWSDGWWEGIIVDTVKSENETYRVYVPGERMFLNIDKKNLRISRDWVGDRWVDIETNNDILSMVSFIQETKVSVLSSITSECQHASPMDHKIHATSVDEEAGHGFAEARPIDGHSKDSVCVNDEKQGDDIAEKRLTDNGSRDMDLIKDEKHSTENNEKENDSNNNSSSSNDKHDTDCHLSDDNDSYNMDIDNEINEDSNGEKSSEPEIDGRKCETEVMNMA
ncbi:uncharacterized protein [Nicotiana sylvestris]|uniref:Uncharacterized protein LOC104216343 n=1 Tax=Nicotiana sylvestris TaxID=4096 RepID=A0A1U7VQN2_NICSY|nr:PREDICTED: uncharacterized protein LOC104216343 [Nicotiana sylvestris]